MLHDKNTTEVYTFIFKQVLKRVISPSHRCDITTGSTEQKINDRETFRFVFVPSRIFLIRCMLQIVIPVVIIYDITEQYEKKTE